MRASQQATVWMQADAIQISPSQAAAADRSPGFYKLGPLGLDTITLQLAAGPAEPLRPLSLVASGGESSRVMLALKAAPTHLSQERQPDEAFCTSGGVWAPVGLVGNSSCLVRRSALRCAAA